VSRTLAFETPTEPSVRHSAGFKRDGLSEVFHPEFSCYSVLWRGIFSRIFSLNCPKQGNESQMKTHYVFVQQCHDIPAILQIILIIQLDSRMLAHSALNL
jgi:hypothetical protein